jgi:hypothetical protein
MMHRPLILGLLRKLGWGGSPYPRGTPSRNGTVKSGPPVGVTSDIETEVGRSPLPGVFKLNVFEFDIEVHLFDADSVGLGAIRRVLCNLRR